MNPEGIIKLLFKYFFAPIFIDRHFSGLREIQQIDAGFQWPGELNYLSELAAIVDHISCIEHTSYGAGTVSRGYGEYGYFRMDDEVAGMGTKDSFQAAGAPGAHTDKVDMSILAAVILDRDVGRHGFQEY